MENKQYPPIKLARVKIEMMDFLGRITVRYPLGFFFYDGSSDGCSLLACFDFIDRTIDNFMDLWDDLNKQQIITWFLTMQTDWN